jgi:phosphate transport system substrate-binding protein
MHRSLVRIACLATGALALVFFAACGGGGGESNGGSDNGDNGSPGGSISGEVVVDGSSTVGPIAEAAAEEFGNATGARVVVGISGTGGGLEKFCRGEIDVANASRLIRQTEFQACTDRDVDMTEIRIALDGLTVAVNPANDWAQCLTFSQLRSIWDTGSTISSWNEVDPSFPDEPLTLFSPGADSGTFDYFTEEVNGVLDQTRSEGVTFSEDDNVLVLGVEGSKGAMGYFGYAFYITNQERVKALELSRDEQRGQPIAADSVLPCTAPAEDTVKQATYPLSRPLYMYVNNAALKEKPAVRAYVEFVLDNQDLISEVGYIGLEPNIIEQQRLKLENIP